MQSIRENLVIDWFWDGNIIDDEVRNVSLVFLNRYDSSELLELVSPMKEKSPVSKMLGDMKNVAMPYHICYEVKDLDNAINILKGCKYILIEKPKPVIAFDNHRIAFILRRDSGLIELLEEEISER